MEIAVQRTKQTVNLILRLPPALHSKLRKSAMVNHRSLNSEVVHFLTLALDRPQLFSQIVGINGKEED